MVITHEEREGVGGRERKRGGEGTKTGAKRCEPCASLAREGG